MKKKIDKMTIIRTAVFALSIINQALTFSGHSAIPVDSEELSNWISWGFTTVSGIWAWWKNNNFTQKAIKAQEYKDNLK